MITGKEDMKKEWIVTAIDNLRKRKEVKIPPVKRFLDKFLAILIYGIVIASIVIPLILVL